MKVVKFVAKIDEAKCTGAKTGQKQCASDNSPNCQATCPLHIDVRSYIGLIREGKFDDALELIRKYAPFAGVLARVCPHPCESECKRGDIDEPVSINPLKRSAGDYGRIIEKDPNNRKTKEEKIAVVGGGPAGLTAAYYLAREGYPVTVFEHHQVAGGMMAVGIPEFRLPRNILSAEIQMIQDMGVDIKTGVTLGENITLDGLRREGYQVLFLATGLHRSLTLNVEGEEAPGVLKGIEFLRDVALGKKVSMGGKVVVIGGGNVAIDVALTAKRLGGREISLVCLEQRGEMPAWDYEIEEAIEEGIEIVNGFGPKRILIEVGKLSGIELRRCTAVFDQKGVFNPQYDDEDVIALQADTAIVAIGQTSDLSSFEKWGIPVSRTRTLQADPITLQTQTKWVFAGGDALYGPKTVVEAVACGKRAAESIKRYIEGQDLTVGREWEGPFETSLEMNTNGFPAKKRISALTLNTNQRQETFHELYLGLGRQEAMEEAERCLSCECHLCEKLCPTGAINIVEKKTRVDESKCIACCMCWDACPQNAIEIVPRAEPITFGLDPAEVDQTRLKELCIKANLHPRQFLCLCSETRVDEVAAAVIKGAKSPEEISLMTGVRSGCNIYCMEPMLRLLLAHGVEVSSPKANRWYNTTPTIWDTPADLAKKYSGYYLVEDKKLFKKI